MAIKSSILWKVHVIIGRRRSPFSLKYSFLPFTQAFSSVATCFVFKVSTSVSGFKSLHFRYAFSALWCKREAKTKGKIFVFDQKRIRVNAALAMYNMCVLYVCIVHVTRRILYDKGKNVFEQNPGK